MIEADPSMGTGARDFADHGFVVLRQVLAAQHINELPARIDSIEGTTASSQVLYTHRSPPSGRRPLNRRLVDLIREFELHREKRALEPLLVVAGLVPEEAFCPLKEDEAIWLLRPEMDRWPRQLEERPVGGGGSGQYDDYEYSRLWHARFAEWIGQTGVTLLDLPFQPELVGRIVEERSWPSPEAGSPYGAGDGC